MAEPTGYAHAATLAATPDLTASLATQLREANATIARVRALCNEAAATSGRWDPVVDVAALRAALQADRG